MDEPPQHRLDRPLHKAEIPSADEYTRKPPIPRKTLDSPSTKVYQNHNWACTMKNNCDQRKTETRQESICWLQFLVVKNARFPVTLGKIHHFFAIQGFGCEHHSNRGSVLKLHTELLKYVALQMFDQH